MVPNKEELIKTMDYLGVLLELKYYDKTEEAEKENDSEIKKYREYLGFDDEFMKLNINW